MWLKVLKWIGVVAICIGLVYTILVPVYKSGSNSANLEHNENMVAKLKESLTTERALKQKVKELTETITEINTRYHDEIKQIESDAASTIDSLRLRDDLARRSCVPDTGDTGRNTEAGECGLRERDVNDLIGLAARADKVTKQLQACQGVLWNLKKE